VAAFGCTAAGGSTTIGVQYAESVTNTVKADFLETTLLKIDGLIINRTVVSSSYAIKRN
jgi:hypothetical protein